MGDRIEHKQFGVNDVRYTTPNFIPLKNMLKSFTRVIRFTTFTLYNFFVHSNYRHFSDFHQNYFTRFFRGFCLALWLSRRFGFESNVFCIYGNFVCVVGGHRHLKRLPNSTHSFVRMNYSRTYSFVAFVVYCSFQLLILFAVLFGLQHFVHIHPLHLSFFHTVFFARASTTMSTITLAHRRVERKIKLMTLLLGDFLWLNTNPLSADSRNR